MLRAHTKCTKGQHHRRKRKQYKRPIKSHARRSARVKVNKRTIQTQEEQGTTRDNFAFLLQRKCQFGQTKFRSLDNNPCQNACKGGGRKGWGYRLIFIMDSKHQASRFLDCVIDSVLMLREMTSCVIRSGYRFEDCQTALQIQVMDFEDRFPGRTYEDMLRKYGNTRCHRGSCPDASRPVRVFASLRDLNASRYLTVKTMRCSTSCTCVILKNSSSKV